MKSKKYRERVLYFVQEMFFLNNLFYFVLFVFVFCFSRISLLYRKDDNFIAQNSTHLKMQKQNFLVDYKCFSRKINQKSDLIYFIVNKK